MTQTQTQIKTSNIKSIVFYDKSFSSITNTKQSMTYNDDDVYNVAYVNNVTSFVFDNDTKIATIKSNDYDYDIIATTTFDNIYVILNDNDTSSFDDIDEIEQLKSITTYINDEYKTINVDDITSIDTKIENVNDEYDFELQQIILFTMNDNNVYHITSSSFDNIMNND